MLVALIIYKTSVITDLKANAIQILFWTDGRKFRANSARFIIILVFSSILIAMVGNIVKSWWVGISFFFMAVTIATSVVIPVVLILFEISNLIQIKLIKSIDKHPRIVSAIFLITVISYTYYLGYVLFENVQGIVMKINQSKEIVIMIGSFTYGFMMTVFIFMLRRIRYFRKDEFEVLIENKKYRLVAVLSENSYQLEAQNGLEYRIIDSTIMNNAEIKRKQS